MLPFKETTESNYIIEYNKKDLFIKKIITLLNIIKKIWLLKKLNQTLF